MTDVKNLSPDLPTGNISQAAGPDETAPDMEDHIIDLHSAIAALYHVPILDSPAGIYLISRVAVHAEGIRRAYYHLPPVAAD